MPAKVQKTKRPLEIKLATESEIQRAIMDWLSWKKIFHYRNNSGAFKTERGGFVRFGAKGSPDIVVIYRGRYIGIEVKKQGGVLSPAQKDFGEAIVKAGGVYLVATSVDEVEETLRI